MKKIITGEIIANSQIAAEHFLLRIKTPFLAEQAIPGQFVTIKVQADIADPLLRIPLAVHDIDTDNISLLYRVVGKATNILSTRKITEEISVLGPLGNGFKLTKNGNAILVAGGIGIAPLYFLAKRLLKQNNKTTVFIGACNCDHILYAEEFRKIGAEVQCATEDGSLGYKGRITELLDSRLRENDEVAVYASGPNQMLNALGKITKQLNIPAQLSMEAYMACGIGVCRGCAVSTVAGYKLCCKDGPVFNAAELDALI